ncbi:MAG: FAD-dependent oxidoreductase [Clostridia bacterium]|nr:FAD-dependent oxidoreductase [Clostridia bacterium]
MSKILIDAEYKGSYDVIVTGGGIAGISAAVSAARGGASVLLLEKTVNLGRLATGGLISWYEPLCDGEGNKVVCGLAEELIKLAVRYGFDNLPEKWGGSGVNKPRNQRYSTFYSPCIFSAALDDFVLESGAKIRFDTLGTIPIINDGRCTAVVTESANGSELFECKTLIDATGDASVSVRAGLPTVVGKNYMTYIAHYYDLSMTDVLAKDKDVCHFRKWMNTGSDMFGNGHPDGMDMLSGGTAEEVTEYIIAGKRSLINKIRDKDKNSFDIMSIPTMAQLRTIRRINGKSNFNAVDGETYSDSIGRCGDFRPDGAGKHYEIPFGALYCEDFPNILAAGRIISAPQGDGWEVARVIPVCALTGEAAGRAATLCAKRGTDLTSITDADIEKYIRVK